LGPVLDSTGLRDGPYNLGGIGGITKAPGAAAVGVPLTTFG